MEIPDDFSKRRGCTVYTMFTHFALFYRVFFLHITVLDYATWRSDRLLRHLSKQRNNWKSTICTTYGVLYTVGEGCPNVACTVHTCLQVGVFTPYPTVKNNPTRFHVKLRNPHWVRCICEIPMMDAKIRILYELLIILIIGIPQIQQSCVDFGVVTCWHDLPYVWKLQFNRLIY